MATTKAILRGKDTTADDELYSSFELGDKQWKIAASDGKRNASRYSATCARGSSSADATGQPVGTAIASRWRRYWVRRSSARPPV